MTEGAPQPNKNREKPIHKLMSLFVSLLLLYLCSEEASGSSDTGFLIEVEGMPEIEGSVVVSMGFGSNMNYTLGTSEATVSISMPGERLVIKYTEAGFICQNYGEATFEFGNDRATIYGKVGCRTNDAHPGEREDAAIEGWFDLDK